MSFIQPRFQEMNAKNKLETFSTAMGMPVTVRHHGNKLPFVMDSDVLPLVQHIRDYVEAPTIVFTQEVTQIHRRKFSLQLEQYDQSLHQWYEKNRLRYNNTYGISYLPQIHWEILETHPDTLLALNSAITHIPDSAEMYDVLPMETRITITSNIAHGLINTFQCLTNINLMMNEENLLQIA